MTEHEIIIAVARSLYWGYGKDTTGTPGNLSDLNAAERKIWMAAGKRAVWKMEQLRSQQPANRTGIKPANGTAAKPANGIAAKPKVLSKPNGRDALPPAKVKPAASALAR